jgi:hypothetical protein
MQRLRRIALVILFAGWMLPALLAQVAHQREPKRAPRPKTRVELMGGVEPPPTPAERVTTMFRVTAGIWFFVALLYAGTLTLRLRRTLVN